MNFAALYVLLKGKINGIIDAIDELTPGYTFKGSVATAAGLPDSDNTNGDLYIVKDEGNAQYAWDGTEFLAISPGVPITTAQIDALFA